MHFAFLFFETAFCTFFNGGADVKFQVRIREYNGRYITSFDNDAAFFANPDVVVSPFHAALQEFLQC